MRIEDDNKVGRQQDVIRRIQEYQAQQEAQQAQQDQAQVDASQVDPADTADAAQIDASLIDQQQQLQQDAQRVDLEPKIEGIDSSPTQTGMEKSDEAVGVASIQQDRAEDWSQFASEDSKPELPPGVEEMRADDQAQQRQEEENKISIRDLMNKMTIQSGQIKS